MANQVVDLQALEDLALYHEQELAVALGRLPAEARRRVLLQLRLDLEELGALDVEPLASRYAAAPGGP